MFTGLKRSFHRGQIGNFKIAWRGRKKIWRCRKKPPNKCFPPKYFGLGL